MSKAKSFETVMLLLKQGAKISGNKKDFINRFEKLPVEATEALLTQCIFEVNEELLVFDFDYFKKATIKTTLNEMDIHCKFQNNDQSQILLHPLMQAFLHLKWNQVKKIYWVNLFLEIIFAILLTTQVYQVLGLTICTPCNDTSHKMSMDIVNLETMQPRGNIRCFGASEGTCENDESCAKINLLNDSIIYENMEKTYGFTCHKYFLRLDI